MKKLNNVKLCETKFCVNQTREKDISTQKYKFSIEIILVFNFVKLKIYYDFVF